jgi:hypothetical protein
VSHVRSKLGQGAQTGSVWGAVDRMTREEVAIKKVIQLVPPSYKTLKMRNLNPYHLLFITAGFGMRHL